ncbi:Mov34/MPN/PAD-1 family protein [Pseudomonas aeruginosa]|uniref:Mov34/MPN/PAD-1 family protein n=1 Tax=Pseudomonas aeruginosa TaxID=287 RepID=UPI00106A9922|nr:Mov34/MPN/PAD-1 family protein [Pseudomonas aeruginosa]MCO3670175.1 hypothetical protein [Pseudomonas aeruginosa]HBO9019095.1 hypothetical protein [Pseudomonas aeruginosa]HEH9487690.1 Mov34/MPN/PAD-1 family protein [Pseudomonas aeruginosa]
MTDFAWCWKWPGVDTTLLVSHDVAKALRAYRQKGWSEERGGQLFVDPSNPAGLALTLATPPHRADRSGRTWLELDDKRCHAEVKEANDKGLRLVGYWHTHPQVIPAISLDDIQSFSSFAVRHMEALPHPLAIIVGTSDEPNGIKAWSFRFGRYLEAELLDYEPHARTHLEPL